MQFYIRWPKLQGLYFAKKKLYKSMASKPGILTEWPWTFLGNFKVPFLELPDNFPRFFCSQNIIYVFFKNIYIREHVAFLMYLNNLLSSFFYGTIYCSEFQYNICFCFVFPVLFLFSLEKWY